MITCAVFNCSFFILVLIIILPVWRLFGLMCHNVENAVYSGRKCRSLQF